MRLVREDRFESGAVVGQTHRRAARCDEVEDGRGRRALRVISREDSPLGEICIVQAMQLNFLDRTLKRKALFRDSP